MPHVLMSRQQHQPQGLLSDSDKLEPAEPAYTKPPKPSAIASANRVPVESTTARAPVVMRGQRMNGMRYLWAHGAVRQPLQALGNGERLGVAVWSSEFQPDLIGPIHDAGFNDDLYQAGYPGFNLGLSFKVPTLQENATGGPGYNMRMNVIPRFTKVQRVQRATNTPSYYNTTSVNGGNG